MKPILQACCAASAFLPPAVLQAAADALDAVIASWDAAAYLPPLMAAAESPVGTARGKAVLLDRLVGFAPALWQARPALVRQHVVPALFALLAAERRPELRQMVQGALAVLAKCMGAALAAAAAVSLPPPQQKLVADIVAAQWGAAPPLPDDFPRNFSRITHSLDCAI
jgi:hypothetical protein